MTIQEYLKKEGFHNEFGSSQLDLIEDLIIDIRERTVKECVQLLNEYSFDDQGVLYNEIKIYEI